MAETLVYRVHAVQRMAERGISTDEVAQVLQYGETIERYQDDRPYPTRLVMGFVQDRPLHLVVAERPDPAQMIIVTVYEPDPALWDPTFKVRKPR